MRSIVRVGYGAAGESSEASAHPTLAASRPVPPHEGEGGLYAPLPSVSGGRSMISQPSAGRTSGTDSRVKGAHQLGAPSAGAISRRSPAPKLFTDLTVPIASPAGERTARPMRSAR